MPTVTTTVTSACASGAVTTQTTTEATPDTGAALTNAASKLCEEMVNVWFTGKLPGRVGEFWSPTCKVEAGPGVVTGWGDYSNHSGLVDWFKDLEGYNFHDMNWTFYPRPGGAVGEWTCSSLENKTTGKKTKKPFTGVNLFDVGADGLITGLRLVLDHTENINTNGDDLSLVEGMITCWGTGNLFAERNTWFPANFVLDGGNSTAPGFQQYTYATIETHLTEMDLYNFNDMKWDFYKSNTGVTAVWSVSSLSRKDNGKATGPLKGVNLFTVEGGKISKTEIVFNDIAQVEALFN